MLPTAEQLEHHESEDSAILECSNCLFALMPGGLKSKSGLLLLLTFLEIVRSRTTSGLATCCSTESLRYGSILRHGFLRLASRNLNRVPGLHSPLKSLALAQRIRDSIRRKKLSVNAIGA